MPEVYPDIVGLNRVQRQHALSEELHRLEDSRMHMQGVLKADREILARHRARMLKHKQEIERLIEEEQELRRRISRLKVQQRLEAQEAEGLGEGG
jgi:hypothetical protein